MRLTDGEREILAELSDGWTDEHTAADYLDVEADILSEVYADLDAMRDNQRRLEAHEAAALSELMRSPAMQAEIWSQPHY
jgi:hypothetical protein